MYIRKLYHRSRHRHDIACESNSQEIEKEKKKINRTFERSPIIVDDEDIIFPLFVSENILVKSIYYYQRIIFVILFIDEIATKIS